jgi:hypothetical protein
MPQSQGRKWKVPGLHWMAGMANTCRTRLCVFIAGVFCIPLVQAQEGPSGPAPRPALVAESSPLAAPIADRRRQQGPKRDDLRSDIDARRRALGIIAGYSLSVGLYGKSQWWQEGFNKRFRTASEGWFGHDTYSGGADKLGHFYMNYVGTRLFARTFEWAGNAPDQSLRLAGMLMLGTFGAIEVLDGFSKTWTFSKEDAVINVAGVGAAYLLERYPELDRVVDLRFQYRPSRNNRNDFDPFGDYSGQTYLFVAKVGGLPALRNHRLLRHVELAIGYGTRNYSSDMAGARIQGTRNIYAGVSLNLSGLLNGTVFANASEEGRVQRLTNTVLEFVQVPGTAVLAKHRLRTD